MFEMRQHVGPKSEWSVIIPQKMSQHMLSNLSKENK